MAKVFLSILGMYNFDEHIFDYLTIPSGLNKDTVIQKILFETAELGLVYTEPTTVKLLIKNWSEANIHNWNKMWKALDAEYNPLHNYNMTESWEDHSEGVGDGTSKRDVAGFNENEDYVRDSRMTDNNSSEVDSNHQGRRSGNIGVTTNQQMLDSEVSLRLQYNMYSIIADSFKKNFCILVY